MRACVFLAFSLKFHMSSGGWKNDALCPAAYSWLGLKTFFTSLLSSGVSSRPVLLDFSMIHFVSESQNRQLTTLITATKRLFVTKWREMNYCHFPLPGGRSLSGGTTSCLMCLLTLWNCKSSLCWNDKSLWETWSGRLLKMCSVMLSWNGSPLSEPQQR